MSNSVVQARVDSAAKKRAEVIFSRLGLTLSDGIRMFISQVGVDEGMPFRPSLRREPNEETQQAMKNALEGKNLIKVGTLDDFKKMYEAL